MSAVRLRAITEADLADYVRWLNDPEAAEHMGGEAGSVTLEQEREWFARITAPEYRKRHWAIEAEGRHIGNCSLSPHATQRKAGFGIMIGEKAAWRKGYGTAASQEMLRIGFTEMDLNRIELGVFPENQRALRCYEKCGFRREGYARQAYFKEGRWRDIVNMAILREEWEARQEVRHQDGLLLRPYRSADHPRVFALWEQAFEHLGPNDEAASIEWKLATQPGFLFVAEAGGEIVGTVSGTLDRGWGWIQRLAVHPDHRRRGIAKTLMRKAEQAHAALGAHRTVLLAGEGNHAARALYEGLGYDTWDGVIAMGRSLSASEEAGEEACCGS